MQRFALGALALVHCAVARLAQRVKELANIQNNSRGSETRVARVKQLANIENNSRGSESRVARVNQLANMQSKSRGSSGRARRVKQFANMRNKLRASETRAPRVKQLANMQNSRVRANEVLRERGLHVHVLGLVERAEGDAGGVAQALPHSRGGGGGNGMHGSSSIIGSHAPVRYRQPAPDPRAGMSAVLAERPF